MERCVHGRSNGRQRAPDFIKVAILPDCLISELTHIGHGNIDVRRNFVVAVVLDFLIMQLAIKTQEPDQSGLTLVELLVIVAIIGILAALLLPILSRAKASSQRTICLNNLRQINFGLRMYADDSSDKTPRPEGTRTNWGLSYIGYKSLIQSYVGSAGLSSPKARLFACPADKFYYTVSNGYFLTIAAPLHDWSYSDFSSYLFNGGNLVTNLSRRGIDVSQLGIAGRTISSIRNPVKTVLIAEAPAFNSYSWHQPKLPISEKNSQFSDAKNVVSFVDGHADYIKIFWTNKSFGGLHLRSGQINPPSGYDYQWSGN